MPLPARRLTLRDVAAELGVSAKTVSNAYVRPDQLSPELRERVLATAARLGYAGPDPVAAGLRRGRVGAIGIAYDNQLSYAFDDPASSALLAGVAATVEEAGAGLLLLPGSSDPRRRDAAVTGAVVDGVVISSVADDDPLLRLALLRRLPVVVVDQPRPARLARLGDAAVPWVGIDDYAAAETAADHVLRLGHRRIGVISFGLSHTGRAGFADVATQEASTYAVSRDRLAGYRAAAARHGVDWNSVPVWAGTDSTAADGAAGAAALLIHEPRPTSLLCLSDRLAEGAIQAATDAGLRIPTDLSIVGFDDAGRLASDLGLTTIRQPHRSKGEQAARALLARLEGHDWPERTALPTELVVRGSVTPPGRERKHDPDW